MVWNYHDEDKIDEGENVELRISGLTASEATMTEYRIDETHSNSYTTWKKMGSPQNPTNQQLAELEKSGQLQKTIEPKRIQSKNGSLNLTIKLPRQAVYMLKFDW